MSKIHVLPDENLGGVLREYVEVSRKAKVGDKKLLPDGTILTAVEPYDRGEGKTPGMWFQDTCGNTYPYYNDDNNRLIEPTDIVHIDGARYRLVDRKAKVGEKVIVTNALKGERDNCPFDNGYVSTVISAGKQGITVNPCSPLYHHEYRVLEPVEPADVLTVDETEASKSVIDLLANLARRVTELERKHREVDDKIEMILDDIVTLDERTQPLVALVKVVKADE